MNEEQNLRRLQCLFEQCSDRTVHSKLNYAKTSAGTYKNPEVEALFDLWLSGHAQGVVDHAVQRGDVQL